MTTTDAFEKMERDGWGDPDIAKGYAVGFEHATQLAAKELSEAVQAGAGMKVLDLCTGHGVVAAELSVRGAAVTGLDFSPAMLTLAKENAPNASFVEGDAMAMTFENGSFDAVTIGFGVPHFPDTARGLAEAARVLKPGGRIAFSIWQGKGSAGAFGWLFDALGRLGDPAVTLPEGPDAHALADRALAMQMLSEAGFADFHLHQIPTRLAVAIPEALFDAFDRGAVRAAALLSGQPAEIRDAIRADLADRTRAEGQKDPHGYLVPAPSVVISGTRL